MSEDPPDPPPYRDAGDDTCAGPHRRGTPRWVYVFGIVAIVLVLLFVILHLTGNSLAGGHRLPAGGH